MKMKFVAFLWIMMISLSHTALIAQAPVWSWANSVGGTGDDYVWFSTVIADGNSN
jgi:hypothetical protein